MGQVEKVVKNRNSQLFDQVELLPHSHTHLIYLFYIFNVELILKLFSSKDGQIQQGRILQEI